MDLLANWCAQTSWCASLAKTAQPLNGSVWQLVALWMVGAFCGWLLPRPKTTGSNGAWLSAASVFSSATAWRRAALAWHGAIIMREVWYHFTCPGTFRRLFKAVLQLVAGKGWHFDFPTASQPGVVVGTPCDPKLTAKELTPEDSWYVGQKDLNFFKHNAEPSVTQPPTAGNGPWEVMMDREIPGLVKYTAWRRTLANGKTEYRSTTISPDATAEEFMDMYFDDDNRPNWDTMIIQHDVVEHGDFDQRQQVVRWIRRFPFSFISDREYVIAKRLFKEGDSLYGLTKAIDHPRAAGDSNIVRVDVFYSMWRSRTVECPWGSGKPACETLLLHHEQMKIPENLARFAVKHGMWGFVRKLSTETPKFVETRRTRCDSYSADPQAYGYGHKPNPPLLISGKDLQTPFNTMLRTDTATTGLSSLTTQSSMDTQDELVYRNSTGGIGTRTKLSSRLRGLAAFAIASGLAMLLRKSSSSERIGVSSPRRGSNSNLRRMKKARTTACLAEIDGL